MMRTITQSDLKTISLVDYVEAFLVTDMIENPQNIIDDIMITGANEKDILSDYLN